MFILDVALAFDTRKRGHPRQFQRFQPIVDVFKYVFLPWTIQAWNALPQAVAEVDSLDIFKRHMSRHLQF